MRPTRPPPGTTTRPTAPCPPSPRPAGPTRSIGTAAVAVTIILPGLLCRELGRVSCSPATRPGAAAFHPGARLPTDRPTTARASSNRDPEATIPPQASPQASRDYAESYLCLLYTSDAADDLLCVDLGGR